MLTAPGPAVLTITTLKVEEAEEDQVQRVVAQYLPQGARPGKRSHVGEGEVKGIDVPGFPKVRVAFRLYKYTKYKNTLLQKYST